MNNNSEFNRRILIVDDTPTIHDDIKKILNTKVDPAVLRLDNMEQTLFGDTQKCHPILPIDYQIDSAFQGQDGLTMALAAVKQQKPYALIFMDIRMPPGWDGITTIEKIWAEIPTTEIVICTAYSDIPLNEVEVRVGISGRLLILKKPFDAIEIREIASTMTTKWNQAAKQ